MGGESVTCSKNLSYRPKGNEEKKVDRVGHDAERVPKNGLESVPDIHGVFREGCIRESSESPNEMVDPSGDQNADEKGRCTEKNALHGSEVHMRL
jgi:hypothetical protein